jgi:EmrB/QacA subfamily drug resistance transporter
MPPAPATSPAVKAISRPSAPAGPAGAPRSDRWWILLTVMIGTVASIMSSTIVNVAVPDMSAVFDLGQERAQWMSTAFMAAMTVSMLATPWLLSRYGYRSTYVGANLLLLVGGVAGGLAGSYEFVMAMRVAEGLAAGVMQPIPAIVILYVFGAREQGKAMGIFGMGVVLAPAIGPSIGGLLVEHFGWRSIFFVVAPFCVAALVMARRHLPATAPGGVAAGRGGGRFDWFGWVLLTVGLLALLNGLVRLHDAGPGALPLLALVLLGLAVAFGLGFIAHQYRVARPLLNLSLFRQRSFAMASLVAFIYGMALFGSTYLVPVFMQLALQLPPSQAGAVLLPAGIVLAITIPIAGRLADRLPIHRLVMTGLLLLALSFALMLGVGSETALWLLMVWTAIGRIGLGFVLPSLNLGAMRGLHLSMVAQGSSTINFIRQLGGAVGVNLIGIFLEWRLHVHGVATATAANAPAQLPAFHESFAVLALVIGSAVFAARLMKVEPPAASSLA